MAEFLIFIDTNIWLDFYRVRGRESDLGILNHIGENVNRFISTSQVEMEFKKHRQSVMLDSHRELKSADNVSLPAFLVESKQSRALGRNKKAIQQLSRTLKTRIERMLQNPSRHDPIYRAAQRLFRINNSRNLNRENTLRFRIRRLAWKRFMLGYPPRKDRDISIGDAINWEWIIHCASESKANVVIVSRDSDFGITFDKNPVLNDWLAQEFRERVGRRQRVALTDRVSSALRAAKITVTREEEESEEELLHLQRERDIQPTIPPGGAVGIGGPFMSIGEQLQRLAQQHLKIYQEALHPVLHAAKPPDSEPNQS